MCVQCNNLINAIVAIRLQAYTPAVNPANSFMSKKFYYSGSNITINYMCCYYDLSIFLTYTYISCIVRRWGHGEERGDTDVFAGYTLAQQSTEMN